MELNPEISKGLLLESASNVESPQIDAIEHTGEDQLDPITSTVEPHSDDTVNSAELEREIMDEWTEGFPIDVVTEEEGEANIKSKNKSHPIESPTFWKSATFRAYEELHIREALNDNLLPIISSRAEEEFVEEETNTNDKNKAYPMASPVFWKGESTKTMEERLFGYTIEFAEKDLLNLGGKH
ncbi:hypothetical protein BGX26_012937 [Mortierella sp. AD094]|nr:hypothetical protein BGX26_012937 [Mortierella sp. AD094]